MSPSTTSPPPELPMSPTLNGPVLIIGSGLLGASIGLGLHAAGYEDVYVQDISPTAEAVAQDIGAGTSFSSLTEDQRARFEPQLVVVAAPPDVAGTVCAQALRTYGPRPETGYPGATVTDVASVKVRPLADVLASGAVSCSRRARGLSASTIRFAPSACAWCVPWRWSWARL